MARIPFIRPNLVRFETYRRYLEAMDERRLYANFGPLNSLLEQRILAGHFRGVGAVSTVNNATTGLMLAMKLAARRGARYAVMPSFTFAATPLAAVWAGLEPYFVDVRLDDFALSEPALQQTLASLGDDVAVVVPYATFGSPIDLDPYRRLIEDGIPVVVDAAASFGARRGGIAFGSAFPGFVVFSFHATKAFGIGEGGLVYSADARSIGELREMANFGFGPDRISRAPGLNAKLPEVSAAIGLALLDEFPARTRRRRQLHEWYCDELDARALPDHGWQIQACPGEVAHQFFALLCPPSSSNAAIVRSMAAAEIELRTYFSPPCHRQPAFESFQRASLANTERLAERALSLPLWEEMTREQVATVVAHLACALNPA